MKKLFVNIGLSLTSLTVLLIVLELIFRISGQPTYEFEKNDSDFIQPDSLLNYKYRSHLDVDISNEDYSIHVQTNALGYRDEEWVFNSDEQNILVIGNSFSAGYGLEKKQRWSDQLENVLNQEEPPYNIYNASVSGYSLNQMLATAEHLSPKIDPDIVILGLFIYGLNRLDNPFVYYKGFSVRKDKLDYAKLYDDELYILHFQNRFLQTVETLLFKYSALYNFTIERLKVLKDRLTPKTPPNNSARTARAISLLQDFNLKMESEGRKFIILPIVQHTRSFDFRPSILEDYKDIKAFCDTEDIVFIDILPTLQDKVESGTNFWVNNDPHWNEEAHKLVAEMILQEFVD